MSDASRKPRVVAELGRPETPEETAARKARDSKLYRQRKTVNNLVLSLIVSLGMVVVIVLAVPRGDYTTDRKVNVVELAQAAQDTAEMPLAVPKLDEGWRASQAELRASDENELSYWYVGYITPDTQFAAFKQAINANPTWIADQLDNRVATGTETRSGREWTVYDYNQLSSSETNARFGLTTESNGLTYIVYGTTTPENVWELADALALTMNPSSTPEQTNG